ncbi:MAG: DUF4114 domain-containing protein [Pedobacter sp.]|nr:DUF4114 domain-containing protein [Chitinophagaceae bacterium]
MKIKIVFFLLLTFFTLSIKAQYNYLGTYTSDGLPNYLVQSDQISTATLNLIHNALPESYPVPTYNPQYISSGYESEIRLTDSAEVWVTFVDEGAGYKNVLGFYSYDLSNPPTTIPPTSQMTIIFPNVSKQGSGGSLVAGNKVRLGWFAANTGIAFFLIADGWRNGAVGNGNWRLFSNPSFNPESNTTLRNHNVLLLDSTNQRIILGFEDIRRDYGSCDNDFNDALFYVTASPYSAMEIGNIAPIESANTSTQSSNDGGLESNGKMAEKIAKRFFERDINPLLKKSNKENQELIKPNRLNASIANGYSTLGFTPSTSGNTHSTLLNYFPTTGMFGSELPYNSTPLDLLQITNATEVYSVDYYNGSDRVSAGLATYTNSRVYDHSKSICDRLNGSSLEDVRTVILRGHKLINITFKKADGEVEYAISFSVLIQPNQYHLYSYWNIDQYPLGQYLNFQAWGKSMGQACAVANNIIEKLESENPVISDPTSTKIPSVYVKKGQYKNGKIYLTIINKAKINNITINGNFTPSETTSLQSFSSSIALNGEKQKDIELSNSTLFDAGVSLTYTGADQSDALYLADGAWGVDYNKTLANNIVFDVEKNQTLLNQQQLNLERNPSVKGMVKGTVNLFRNAKAGNMPLDILEYAYLSFEIKNTHPVEVVLVNNDLINWNQRARFEIGANNEPKMITIPIAKFIDSAGGQAVLNKIKSLVFTIQGDYQNFTDFKIDLGKVNFNNAIPLIVTTTPKDNVRVYPNPVDQSAILSLPTNITNGSLTITDAIGRIMRTELITTSNGEYILKRNNLQSGMYFFKVIASDKNIYKGSFIIK